MMTNTEPERYDYPRRGETNRKIPNQRDIQKLYQNFDRRDSELITRLIVQGAMRPGEVLQLEKDEVAEKEKSFQVAITEGLGKRNIEIAKTPQLTELLEKALSRDLEHITPLTQVNYRNKLNLAREKAGEDIPEEVKVSTHALRAAGIHRLIDKGFCKEDVEAYTGSSNSGFIEKLFEQHRQEPFIDNWETDEQETKEYTHKYREDEELAVLREGDYIGKVKGDNKPVYQGCSIRQILKQVDVGQCIRIYRDHSKPGSMPPEDNFVLEVTVTEVNK